MSETNIHITIAALLDVYAHPNLIWFHPANGEKRNIITAARLKRMGVKPGVADFCFTLPDGRSAFMEVKTPKGRMSPSQLAFRARCHIIDVPYVLVTNPDDAMTILAEWGALRPVAWSASKPKSIAEGQRDGLVPILARRAD